MNIIQDSTPKVKQLPLECCNCGSQWADDGELEEFSPCPYCKHSLRLNKNKND